MIEQSDLQSVAVISFDTLSGPVLRYQKKFDKSFTLNIAENLTSFYLMFNGGSALKPKVIQYDEFRVFTFMKELDLYCFFLKVKEADQRDYQELEANASKLIPTINKPKGKLTIKEKMRIYLQEQTMTVKQLRKHFRFNMATVRKYLKGLEEEGIVETKGKDHCKEIIWGLK